MVTRCTMRTSLRIAESRSTSISRGLMSFTSTSAPLGSGTSEVCSRVRQTDPENVSGMTLVIARGSERSFSSSLPLPLINTTTAPGCSFGGRPGGASTATFSVVASVSVCWAATAAYSMSAKKRAASLIGQFRAMSWVRLMGIEQPLYQCNVYGGIPLFRADHFLDDHTIAINHEALGNARRLQGLLDRSR